MRLSTPSITDDPLPLSFGAESGAPGPVLRPEAVAQFDALLHELYPDAVRVDADRVRNLCVWLASMPAQAAQDVLDRRLRRIDELRMMVQDECWDAPEPVRARLAKLIAYLDKDEDLIPDQEPLIGKLDDVLLLELAWPAFAAEAEDYRDFCAYRSEKQSARHGGRTARRLGPRSPRRDRALAAQHARQRQPLQLQRSRGKAVRDRRLNREIRPRRGNGSRTPIPGRCAVKPCSHPAARYLPDPALRPCRRHARFRPPAPAQRVLAGRLDHPHPELVERCVAHAQPAVAVTDQNNLFALVKFYKAAEGAGIKPIAGADLLLADGEEARRA
jgi:uncharacterized membrane protein YkvA (DUF1232 family)